MNYEDTLLGVPILLNDFPSDVSLYFDVLLM
jgi:hypothetical protein